MQEVILETHKIELAPYAKSVRQTLLNQSEVSQSGEDSIEEIIKSMIHPTGRQYKMDISNCPSFIKNDKLKVYMNYKKFNNITKKDWYSIPFCDEIFEEVEGHELYYFMDGYDGYHEVNIIFTLHVGYFLL